jgi:hypothetical protein
VRAHLAKLPFELNSILEHVHHLAKLIGKEQELLDHMRHAKDGTALTTYRLALQFLNSQVESDEFKSMDELVQRSAKTTSEMGIMRVCHLYLFFFRKNMS